MKKGLLFFGASLLAAGVMLAQDDVVPSGAVITVRTDEHITATKYDGRVYGGTVNDDVLDRDGRVAVPRGAHVELVVRQVSNHDMILDLDSVDVSGHRYGVRADADEVRGSTHSNGRTAKAAVGGGILGTIVGAVAGGGKGAAIGAAAGAATGATLALTTRGKNVNIPAEYLVSFRLERPLVLASDDAGYDRDGRHYHRYPH